MDRNRERLAEIQARSKERSLGEARKTSNSRPEQRTTSYERRIQANQQNQIQAPKDRVPLY